MAETRFDIWQALAAFVLGGGIGWLSGLSVSPIISSVLSTLVGVGGSLALGVRSSASGSGSVSRIDARPAAIMMLGVAVAAPLGIVARTHNIFGVAVEPLTGIAGRPGEEAWRQTIGGLFAATPRRCAELMAQSESANPEALGNDIRALGADGAALVERIRSVDDLKLAVRAICSRE